MRRRSTILDVLREAQEANQLAAQPDPRGVVRDDDDAGSADDAGQVGEDGGQADRAVGTEVRQSWLAAPAAVPRVVLIAAAAAVLLAFWGMYALGARSRPADFIPSGPDADGTAASSSERQQPKRMRQPQGAPGRNGAPSGFAGNDTKRDGQTVRTESRQGYRIVTYNKTRASRTLALAMRAYLREHLQGTGATVEWFDARRIKKYIVAVMFPRVSQDDTDYRATLLAKLRAIPAPDPRDLQFDFAKIEGQVMTGRVRVN